MKRNQWKLGLLAVLLVATLTGCGKTGSDKLTLEGTWVGFDEGAPSQRMRAMFGDGRFAYWDAQTNSLGYGTYVLNETVKPAQIDLVFETSQNPAYVGKKALGIYEFQGNQLKMAGNQPGNPERPTSFVGTETTRVLSWKRE